jgi:hypothetical protein
MSASQYFDYYSLRARLCPALLALFPGALIVFAWTGVGPHWESVIWTTFGTIGGTFFLAVLARNAGKAVEPALWTAWGGPPSTEYLRHSGPANSLLRARWHKSMGKLLGVTFPSAQEETADPAKADEIYRAATKLLIDKTRDTKKYPLVFKENIAYGFCRNLLGLKWIGLIIALLGTAACVTAAFMPAVSKAPPFMAWILAVICAMFLICWIFMVRPKLVRVPAVAYAERLLESSETLAAARTTKPKKQE